MRKNDVAHAKSTWVTVRHQHRHVGQSDWRGRKGRLFVQSGEEGVIVTPVDPCWLTEQIIVFLTADQQCIFILSSRKKTLYKEWVSFYGYRIWGRLIMAILCKPRLFVFLFFCCFVVVFLVQVGRRHVGTFSYLLTNLYCYVLLPFCVTSRC